MTARIPANILRARFAAALSDMYRAEVPQYGALLDLVAGINRATLSADPDLARSLAAAGELSRLETERHGAIRLGTADELALVARAFAVLGMEPVGYYDLAAAGVPVHSTAFRPVGNDRLTASPFRVFTSLLRLDLIADARLRAEASAILSQRRIMNDEAVALIGAAETNGGLDEAEADRFLPALLETFRWHAEASVSDDVYQALLASHRLVADVVSFRGPHINHLTPRTLDIDAAHARMAALGFGPKDVIEGPPRRACPVLLRQTSFKALNEPVRFAATDGGSSVGAHTARFGEIEQRGAALTAKGRALYDQWIAGAIPAETLPDDWTRLRRNGLAWFRYRAVVPAKARIDADLDALIDDGAIVADPVTYEDFLPVSAAGIFRSNLGDEATGAFVTNAEQSALEKALGRPILNPMTLYAAEERASLRTLEGALGRSAGSLTPG